MFLLDCPILYPGPWVGSGTRLPANRAAHFAAVQSLKRFVLLSSSAGSGPGALIDAVGPHAYLVWRPMKDQTMLLLPDDSHASTDPGMKPTAVVFDDASLINPSEWWDENPELHQFLPRIEDRIAEVHDRISLLGRDLLYSRALSHISTQQQAQIAEATAWIFHATTLARLHAEQQQVAYVPFYQPTTDHECDFSPLSDELRYDSVQTPLRAELAQALSDLKEAQRELDQSTYAPRTRHLWSRRNNAAARVDELEKQLSRVQEVS